MRRGRGSREAGFANLNSVHFRITLAYDGTDFEGWQVQGRANARTVQGEVQAALAKLAGGAVVDVEGAGRTDTGVHALGQVASFDLARAIGAGDLLAALNGWLPRDVRVIEAAEVDSAFHARRSATSKLYRYEIDSCAVQVPTRSRYAAHVREALDLEAMREAAALYLGKRDFASVASAGGSVRTTVREVLRSELLAGADLLRYEVEADGFLRKMVRSLVGGLIAVGNGKTTVADLSRALEARDRRGWPPPAAARGLTLVEIRYPNPQPYPLRVEVP